MAKIPILLLGATGYFGGSVLDRLLSHPNKEAFDITVLVRSPEKAKKLEAFDVKSFVGSFEDTALLEQLAENAHVLFSTADSDNLDAVRAFLAGLKKRHAKTGERPILIHTSGTSVTAAGDASTKGLRITEKIFNDDDPDDIERSIPSTAYHRDVDLAIVNADKDGYVFSYIVIPSTVWGTAKHTLVDAGISNPRSIQVPWLIQASLDRGQAGVVGKGQALWPNVHIKEQTDLFMILFDAVMADPSKVGHGRDGYYFGANGEHSWYDISKYIGKAMVKRGLSKSDEPTTFSNEELVQYWGTEDYGNNYGSNARVRAGHSRSLGWQPKLSTQDFLDSIDDEVEAVIQRRRAEQEEEIDKERKRHEYIKQITKDHVIQA